MSRLVTTIQGLGHRTWFARVGRAYTPIDRALGKLTKGRLVLLGVKGLPSLLITTIGRKSGEERSNPLVYTTDGDSYVVIGSNWGQDHQPAWALNLVANPQATLTVDGRTVRVRATLASGAERARLRELLLKVWPAYATYEVRAAPRELMVFRLAPEA